MMTFYEIELTPANRAKLAQAFIYNPRVDYGIDTVLEGEMGRVYASDPENPSSYAINVGPFWYYAGQASTSGARQLLEGLPPYALLMPSPPGWLEAAHSVYPDRLKPFTRYSFSTHDLSIGHLEALLRDSPHAASIVPLDAGLAERLASLPGSFFDVEDYGSVREFVTRGMGYTLLDGETIPGAAYASLVCRKGIEVSIYVEEAYRREGIATALACRLLVSCLRSGKHPNWDAANPESCKLALKLGYRFAGDYEAYYYTP